MNTLVVYESMWGNTRAVAEAVAERLGDEVTLVDVADAPERLPADLDLLVVGGPTHAFSMSRASTRRDAVGKGADSRDVERGIREWLSTVVAPEPVDVATFDTRVGSVKHLPGSAAKAAGRDVRRHHLGQLVATASFFVDDMDGPLSDGELDRARTWGASLAGSTAAHD
ncbi:flavodoxin family protein [Nocardioides terrigena]|uniref:flavodoxin family protein n=1 Tax=Nocardioides terrigena TaxID=424797 RepID=UPI000D3105C4|nr:flavodoxin domain-containing protein [Nocardioides terrigena]